MFEETEMGGASKVWNTVQYSREETRKMIGNVLAGARVRM